MKKWISLILVAVMTVSLVACGGSSSGGSSGGGAAPAAPAEAAPADEGGAEEAAPAEAAASDTGEATAEGYAAIFGVSDKDAVNGMLMPSDLESRAGIDKALPTEKKTGLKIGFSQATMSNPYFIGIMDAAQETCDKYGYEVTFMNAETDGDQMIANVEAFLAQGVDAIVLDPCDVQAATALVAECVAQGVPVVGIGGALDPKCATVTSILANNYLNGWEAGIVAGEAFKDEANIMAVAIIGLPGFANSKSRINGQIAGMIYTIMNAKGQAISVNDARYIGYNAAEELFNSGKASVPEINMEIGGYGQGQWTDEGGMSAMEDLLTANPNVNLVLAENDWMALGAIRAIEASGLVAGEDVKLIAAADGAKEGMDAVREGKLLCTGYNPPTMLGQCSIDLIKMIFEDGYDASNMPAATSLDSYAITKDNLDRFYDPNGNYSLPYDIVWKSIDDLAATADFK